MFAGYKDVTIYKKLSINVLNMGNRQLIPSEHILTKSKGEKGVG